MDQPSAVALPSAFPVPRGRLIGRDDDLAALLDRLAADHPPLVTLTGPGGVGKTRFALEAARRLAPRFRTTAMIPLAGLTDPGLVLPTIARALGLRPAPGREPLAALASALADWPTLLLLDNAEHLLAVAPDLAALLDACPALVLLVTSRASLRLRDEQRVPLAPLTVPPVKAPSTADVASFPAAVLFVERARLADPGFALTDANAATVAQIVRRLDGLPLAIELAAAWSATLPPAALLPRLEHALPLLTGGPVDQPERLRTVRAAVAWSHDLLTEPQRRLFRRLAVFEDGFTLAGAAAVLGDGEAEGSAPSGLPADPLPLVAALADASLLHLVPSPDDEARFGMLETIRAFAVEHLDTAGERDAAERARAQLMRELSEAAEPHLCGPQEFLWHDRLNADLANLRGAIAWTVAHDPGLALRITAPLWLYWMRNGLTLEGQRQMTQVLAAARLDSAEPANVTASAVAGGTAVDARVRSRAFSTAAAMAILQDTPADAMNFADAAGRWAEVVGDPFIQARALFVAGIAPVQAGNMLGGVEPLTRCRRLWQGTPSTAEQGQSAYALAYLGLIAFALGNPDQAVLCYDEALAEIRGIGFSGIEPLILNDAASLLLDLGRVKEARSILHDALRMVTEYGERWHAGHCLYVLGMADALSGEPQRAAFRLGAGDTLRVRTGLKFIPVHMERYARARQLAIEQIGPAAFEAEFRRGAADPSAVLRAAIANPDPPAPGPAPLSPREQDVLALLAAGRTDREIADTLGISRRTASHHVASILAKLGAENRTAAVARFAVSRSREVGDPGRTTAGG